MALVFKKPRFAAASVSDDTICAVFSKDDINKRRADLFSVGLIRLLIKRLRETTGRIGK
jgi:CRP-like cAMP-binding protein